MAKRDAHDAHSEYYQNSTHHTGVHTIRRLATGPAASVRLHMPQAIMVSKTASAQLRAGVLVMALAVLASGM